MGNNKVQDPECLHSGSYDWLNKTGNGLDRKADVAKPWSGSSRVCAFALTDGIQAGHLANS